MIRTCLCLLLSLACLAAASELPDEFGVDITLVDGVFQDRGSQQAPRSIWMSVRRLDGRWQPVLTMPDRVNAHYSLGFVREATVGADRVDLSVAFELRDDPWVPGGWGFWEISLSRGPDGAWTGSYDGEFADRPLQGAAHAEVHPTAERFRSMAAPGEHPRLLFRQADLPALQARLQTEFGAAAARRMTNAPGLALRYALTGDTALAQEALAATRVIIADESNGSKHVAHRVWGWRLLAVSIAFDCCYDAWTPDERAEVAAWLQQVVDRVLHQHQAWTEYTGWGLGQRFGTNLLGAAAVGTLVLLGEPGAVPTPPVPSLGGQDPRQPLPPSTAIPDDAPLAAFTPGAVPRKWHWVGGLFPADGDEVLPQLGGPESALLTLGGNITAGGKTTVVAELPEEAFRHGGIDVVKANGHSYFSDNWFATVLRLGADQAGTYRFDAGFDTGIIGGQTWIAGKPLADKDVLTLGAGDYLLLIKAPCSQTNPWGMIQIKPRMVPLDAAEAARRLAHLDEVTALRAERFAQEVAYHEATGADVAHWKNFAMAEGMVHANIRHFIRDGGFQTGAREPLFGWENLLRYPLVYRNTMGRDLSTFGDITQLLPRMVFTQITDDNGEASAQRINGRTDFGVKDWFDPERDAASELFACLFPLAGEPWKPALHTAWNDQVGGSIEALGSSLGGQRHDVDFRSLDVHPLYAFVSSPLDREPAPLASGLPRFWAADGLGWYALRSDFANSDDVLVQVFGKTWSQRNWQRENAGVIRLAAFGQEWWTGPAQSGPERFLESVPVIGDSAGSNPDGIGRITTLESSDETMVIGIDLDDLWAAPQRDAKGKALEYHAGVGGLARRDRLQNSDVTAMRQVAVDTSGASGAPVLLVLVDRIRGGEQPTWRYHLDAITERFGRWEIVDAGGKQVKRKLKERYFRQGLPEGHRFSIKRYDGVSETYQPPKEMASVAIDGNRFSINKGDATMSGVVIGNDTITLREDVQEIHYQLLQAKNNHHDYRMGSWSILADGSDTYLAVMTVQQGAAPAVSIDGTAEKALITVGGQTVRWDGERLHFGQE